MLVKSTTRHVHIFAAALVDGELEANETDLTLDVDPDNELNWTDGALQKVYAKFEALVAEYSGADLTDYTLRRIGSDLEHFIRSLLQAGEVTYNLNHRALNYSMGLPQIVPVENTAENGAATTEAADA
ncbi:MAG: NAD(P)H-quinone oxidoreductase subunit M [Pseudanabaenaceae cyanobacterium]